MGYDNAYRHIIEIRLGERLYSDHAPVLMVRRSTVGRVKAISVEAKQLFI